LDIPSAIDPSQPYVGCGSLGPRQDDGGDGQAQHRGRDMQAAEDAHLMPTPFVIIGWRRRGEAAMTMFRSWSYVQRRDSVGNR
jgi:hypothetical protein